MLADQVWFCSSKYFIDKAIFPAQIHDCKAAVRWLRANHKTYGYSTKNLTVAGGMLAALLGTSGEVSELEGEVGKNLDQSSKVQAVIDFYGATDFILRSKTQPIRANEKVTLAKMASAVYHVTKDDPPMLVFHGENDNIVLPNQSKRIYDTYLDMGLPIRLITVKNARHGGKKFYTGDNKRIMIDFLKKVNVKYFQSIVT